MAKRRMFSSDVVDNDQFLDMPVSARCLYYDLGMRADDDGFVSPKKVLRLTSASDDDLKVLISKNFVIPFESGVIVITDWKLNNFIRNDRYTETLYKTEKAQLSLNDNKSYIPLDSGIPVVDKRYPQVRLGKVRLGKDSIQVSKDTVTPVYGNKDLISLREFLIAGYTKPLMGITDTRKLQNLKQICTPRKNQDEWMNENWKNNMKKFLALYLEETPEEYLVNSIDKLREKAKLWREYRGKLS